MEQKAEDGGLPCWVSPPDSASASDMARNRLWWLECLAAVSDPGLPLWNRAWRLACDVGPPLASFGPQCDNGSLSVMDAGLCAFYEPLYQLPAGAGAPPPLVYVPTLCLPAFVQHVLPRVPAAGRLVLVTGLADWGPARVFGGGSEPAGRAACDALLADARIVCWWAEMLDFGFASAAKRVMALPLGVDLHTLAFKPSDRPAWGPPQPPLQQAAGLWAAAAAASHADPRAFVCWGIRNRRRLAVSEVAAAQPSVYHTHPAPPGSLRRNDFWAAMGAHAWTACVQGYGRDCHRTWEVLALGGGVVVEDMPFTRRCLQGFEGATVFLSCGSGEAEEGGKQGSSGSGSASGRGSSSSQRAPRHTFSKPWQELGQALAAHAAAGAAAAAASGGQCPGMARLQLAAGGGGGAPPPLAPGLGVLALALKQELAGSGSSEGGSATPVAALSPPPALNRLLLAGTWLQAMRASAHA